ncbi:MAG: sulfatase [Bacteroidales bacterium]|nr:sulfatase [Bacteroidales bacterium]
MGCGEHSKEATKPNILFCIMDDASPHMGAYGFKWVNTPTFDRLAKEGILFTNTYTPNAKCAPSRSSLLTGRNSWQLEEAANHVVNFPAKFKTFPEVLRDNGYVTALTGKGWGPGNPGMINGEPRLLIGNVYNEIKNTPWTKHISHIDYAANFEEFLDDMEEGKSWFFWYGSHEPHNYYEYGTGQRIGKRQLSDIDSVPAYWPDNDIVRNDMLDYGLEIDWADMHLGRMIESLEKRGMLENTVIVMTSDHGMPFPRCKGQSYEMSNNVPMAIMWPKGIKNPGRIVTDMVSFIDFAPTFLELAGIPVEESGMHSTPGKSLTDILNSEEDGQINPERDVVLIGKERHDYSRPKNQGFPMRGIASKDFLYIYNYDISLWPAGNPEIGYLDIDGGPTKTEILRLFRSGENDFYWNLSMGKRESIEELYNISNDVECMKNLASDPDYAELKTMMKSRMEIMLKEQEDPRMFGKGDIFNSYGYSEARGWNYYERFMAGDFTIDSTGWVNPGDAEKMPLNQFNR